VHRAAVEAGAGAAGIILAAYAGPGVEKAWDKADIETKKGIIRMLGMRITINRVGPGNTRTYDPESVSIEWA
jgi:hypothetical protein